MNKNVFGLIMIGIIALVAIWFFIDSNRNSSTVTETNPIEKHTHPSSEQVKAIASRLSCKNPVCELSSLTDCECDSSNIAQKQITAMLLTGLTPEGTVEHMFMMGYDPVDKEKFEKGLPSGNPPVSAPKDATEGH